VVSIFGYFYQFSARKWRFSWKQYR
jgi:hypothetical protein